MSTLNTSDSTSKRQVLDYTSRDYKAIRTMLVGLAKGYMPDWQTVGETGDFGTLLLELYSYVGDVMNYYIDRIASEAFLGTAVRRQSVLYLADMLGYRPMGQRAATVPVTFTWQWDTDNLVNGKLPVYTYPISKVAASGGTAYLTLTSPINNLSVGQTLEVSGIDTTLSINTKFDGKRIINSVEVIPNTTNIKVTYSVDSTDTVAEQTSPSGSTAVAGSIVIIPAGTQLSSAPLPDGSTIIFETDISATLDSNNGMQSSEGSTIYSVYSNVTASEGITVNPYLIGTSKGIPNAEFVINNAGVIDGTVKVYTKEGGQLVTWDNVDKISLAMPTQSAFTTYVDDDNYTHVLFGDKNSGRIPPANVEIYVSYRYGVGAAANDLTAGSITSLSNDYANTLGVTVTNSKMPAGGADIETIDSMRYSIPRSTALNKRAVTLEDFGILALQVPGITKAVAYGSNYTSVFVRIAANSDSYGTIKKTITGYQVLNNVATVSLDSDIPLSTGQDVYISDVLTGINGSKNVGSNIWYSTKPITNTNVSYDNSTKTATITTSISHGFKTGQLVTIKEMTGTNPAKLNGTHVITSKGSKTFTFVLVTAAGSSFSATSNIGTVEGAPGFTVATTGVSNTEWVAVPTNLTTLSAAITSTSATSITVTSATGISVGSVLRIDSEKVKVSAVSGTTLTVIRGYDGTTANTHLNGANVYSLFPSMKTTDIETARLIASLESYLSDKKLIGSVVYGEGAEWTDVDVKVEVSVLPLYNRESVRSEVQNAVLDVFKYDNVDFGRRITPGDVYKAVLSVDGVDYASITRMTETDGTTASTLENVNDKLVDPENAKRIPRINPLINNLYPTGWVTATGGLTTKAW